MNKILTLLALGVLFSAAPAAANHIFNAGPYASLGECQVASTHLSNEDADSLLVRYPELFSSKGEVRSFLNRAFKCEQSANDGQWYIADHRTEVLNSPWYLRRQ